MLVLAGDGSFCNRTCFGEIAERTEVIAGARPQGCQSCAFARRAGIRAAFTALEKFTPEQVRQDESRSLGSTTKIFYGGKRRKIRYKEVAEVYWQRGAKQRPLRLIVIAPTPYRKRKSSKLYYRDPAYLLTTDLHSSVKQLLQIYFDRWQIEVNHREEKDTLGVGQAQLWNVTCGAQTAGVGGSCLQRSVAGLAHRLRCRTRCRLCSAAQVAAQGPPAFLPGSDHAAAQGNGRTPRTPARIRGPSHGKTTRPRCRRLRKCRNSRVLRGAQDGIWLTEDRADPE